MGRGLSGLQRWILQHIFEHGTVTNAEIFQGYFDWPAPQRIYGMRGRGAVEPYRQLIRVRGFSPQVIGRKRYHVVTATVSRARRRLFSRGLVRSDYGACGSPLRLTEQGHAWCLSVKRDGILSHLTDRARTTC
jgi:hypothetical protein